MAAGKRGEVREGSVWMLLDDEGICARVMTHIPTIISYWPIFSDFRVVSGFIPMGGAERSWRKIGASGIVKSSHIAAWSFIAVASQNPPCTRRIWRPTCGAATPLAAH